MADVDSSESESDDENRTTDRGRIVLKEGALVRYEDTIYRIRNVGDFKTVVGVDIEAGSQRLLKVDELLPVPPDAKWDYFADVDLEEIRQADWDEASRRYAVIEPFINTVDVGRKDIETRAREFDINPSTLYRWLERYRATGVRSSLIPRSRGWQQGKSRLSTQVEAVINEVIEKYFLTVQRISVQHAVVEVQRLCHSRGIKPPSPNTIRLRIERVPERRRLRERGQRERAKNKFTPVPGRFPNADYPLSVVQIDHSPVDLIIVDDEHRKPIGRPYLTVAIDVYSRMVVGYYLALDPPSTTSVAMCVAHAILPKDEWLALHNVQAKWPVWGFPVTIHVDNGPDFRSDSFRRSCEMHNINLEFRPVKQPRYGGHIERYVGTIMKEIHALPGTTFSSVKEKGEYDSEKHAVFTKEELERVIVNFICNVYHERLHRTLEMSPRKKWEIGIFGNEDIAGTGLPERPAHSDRILLDFLPAFQRTVQPVGVTIDKLAYYADVLRPWINANDPDDPKQKRKFTFRRDPRDISVLWFFDPDEKTYFKVPCSDPSLPPLSAWEYAAMRKRMRELGLSDLNSALINRGITYAREQTDQSAATTKKARRAKQRRVEHEKRVSPAFTATSESVVEPVVDELTDDDLEDFSELE